MSETANLTGAATAGGEKRRDSTEGKSCAEAAPVRHAARTSAREAIWGAGNNRGGSEETRQEEVTEAVAAAGAPGKTWQLGVEEQSLLLFFLTLIAIAINFETFSHSIEGIGVGDRVALSTLVPSN